MKNKTLFTLALYFFLVSCASAEPEPTGTAVPSSTHTAIPTSTETLEPEPTITSTPDSLAKLPEEMRRLIGDGTFQSDVEKQIVYDSDGLVQAVHLPNGEWKTDFNGALTIQTKEGQTISFPLYADGQSLLKYIEQTDIIRDDKDIVVKGGPWVSDRTTRADISFSPDLQRVDDLRRIIYVQYGSDNTVSVQYKTQPNFHWLDNLQSFFVFDLFEHIYNDELTVSWVAIPLPEKEEIVFVLGGESEVFAELRLVDN